MKSISKKEHPYHLRKRAILEFFGLAILVIATILQWDTVVVAAEEIKQSDKIYVLIALGLYWLMLPLTAISYRLLLDKKLNIWTTTLAQLAGSGPGRIIPGGLGRLSLSVVHIIKLGYSSSKAITTAVASNLVGVIVNLTVLFLIILFEPSVTSLFNAKTIIPSVLGLILLIAIAVSIYQWLLHAKSTKKSTKKLSLKWKAQVNLIIKNPTLFFELIVIALLILIGLAYILILSASALGIDIDIADALIALSVGVFVGGILPTPGGIGGVEAGIVSTLVFIGYSPSDSTSIALLFRAITYWQPLLPGTIAYFYLRKRKLL